MDSLSQDPVDQTIVFIKASEIDQLLKCLAFNVATAETYQSVHAKAIEAHFRL
jgi:hypothetical protein